jgi:hypothetical protein
MLDDVVHLGGDREGPSLEREIEDTVPAGVEQRLGRGAVERGERLRDLRCLGPERGTERAEVRPSERSTTPEVAASASSTACRFSSSAISSATSVSPDASRDGTLTSARASG